MTQQESEQSYIRNCAWGYSCDKKWNNLSKTNDGEIRFCNTCQREVHHCEDKDQIASNIALNRCVNFSSNLIEENTPPTWGTQLTGVIAPKQQWGKKQTSQQFNEPSMDFDDDIPF